MIELTEQASRRCQVLAAEVGRRRQQPLTRQHLEGVGLQANAYAAGQIAFRPHAPSNALRRAPQVPFDLLGLADVLTQGAVGSDALGGPRSPDPSRIAGVGQFIEVCTGGTELVDQELRIGAGNIADGGEPKSEQPRHGLRPGPPKPGHRQRGEPVDSTRRRDHGEAVRFVVGARHLGDVLRACHANRDVEAGGLADPLLDLPTDGDRRAEEAFRPRHVEERLVQRDRFDMRREVAEDRHDLAGQRLVAFEARRHHDGLRTATPGFGHRHGAADAIGPRFVTRRQHDPAMAVRSDENRLATQLGVVQLLHGRIEGIHVGVNHDARPVTHDAAIVARTPPT